MSGVVAEGFFDFRREADGSVTAVAVTEAGARRVKVRVSVEREHRRADGTLVAAGEVASSDRPEGEVGAVRFA